MKRVVSIPRESDFFLWSFGFAIFIYAIFSEPTPDIIGFDEIAIGFFLLLTFIKAVVNISGIFLFKEKDPFLQVLYFIFIYMISVPTIIGLIRGNSFSDFVRDFVPLLYLFLPLMIKTYLQNTYLTYKWFKLLIFSLLFIGFSFCVRFYLSLESFYIIGQQIVHGDRSYIFASPAILFAVVFSALSSLYFFSRRKVGLGIIFVMLGIFVFGVPISVILRSHIILTIISIAVFLLVLNFKLPRYSWILTLLFIGAVFLLIYYNYNFLLSIYSLILYKFQSVGLNNRDLEFFYVIDRIHSGYFTIFLGEGWGAILHNNPTGGDTRYTHNIITYFLFKTGIVGVFMIVLYLIYTLTVPIKFLIRSKFDPFIVILLLCILNHFIIFMLLQPGFKFLTNGLILTIAIMLPYVFRNPKLKFG